MIDPTTNTWAHVQAHLLARERRLMDELATPGTEHGQTENIRGRLAEVKALMALPQQSAAAAPLQPKDPYEEA